MTTEETFVPPLDLTPLPAGGPLTPAPTIPSTTTDQAEEAREEAFTEEFTWNGKKLQPFSVDRYCAFVSQRVAMGAPTLYRAIMDGSGFYPDALRILWLCSNKSSEISHLSRHPEAMQQEIMAWAEQHAPLDLAGDIVTLGLRIYNSSQLNRHTPRHASAPGSAPSSGN